MAAPDLVTHRGGCHCRRVRFEVDAPARVLAQDCNCSICRMTGFLHLIVEKSRFRLLTDPVELAEYTWNTGVARHFFCRTCGIKSFYVPRSNPDGIDVNVHCIDPGTVDELQVEAFDGNNWEANAGRLSHLA